MGNSARHRAIDRRLHLSCSALVPLFLIPWLNITSDGNYTSKCTSEYLGTKRFAGSEHHLNQLVCSRFPDSRISFVLGKTPRSMVLYKNTRLDIKVQAAERFVSVA